MARDHSPESSLDIRGKLKDLNTRGSNFKDIQKSESTTTLHRLGIFRGYSFGHKNNFKIPPTAQLLDWNLGERNQGMLGENEIPPFLQKCLAMTFCWACGHPLLFVMVGFFVLAYWNFPSFFGLVVSFSPVIACTLVLLEIILYSNRTSSLEVEEGERTCDCSSFLNRGKTRGSKVVVLCTTFDDRKNKDGNSNSSLPSHQKKEDHNEKNVCGDTAIQFGMEVSKISHDHSHDSREIRPSPTKDEDASVSGSEDDVDSLDASMGEALPTLDEPELHPLLDIESIQSVLVSDSYASSEVLSQGHDSDENENRENKEEEESQEEKDRITESVMKWTVEDEKNVRDVGKIEVERNKRLEHLISKRRSRNYQREAEKNLIDLGSNESTSIIEELSRLLVMIPPKKNPFDTSEEKDAVPGSAPSIILPRMNPFDRPYDNVNLNQQVMHMDLQPQQIFLPLLPKDPFFKRYESFAIGQASIDHRQEKRLAKFRPYFMAERNDIDETNYTRLGNQSSGISDSKVSSTIEDDEESIVTEAGMMQGPSVSSHNQKQSKDGSDGSSTDESSSCDSKEIEVTHETRIVGPVYDRSQSTLDYLDKQKAKSSSSLASDMEVEISEPGSPCALNDQMLLSGEGSLPDKDDFWVASPSLSFLDINESSTRELKVITEHDVIEVDFKIKDEHNYNFVASSSVELSQFDGITNAINAQVSLNKLVVGDNLVSRVPSKEDLVPPSPPSTFGIVESSSGILPTIPEENLEEVIHDEEKYISNDHEGIRKDIL